MEDIVRNNILQAKFARIIAAIALRLDVPIPDAMSIFYNSDTAKMIENGIADLHCRSDEYLAEEIIREYQESNKSDKILG